MRISKILINHMTEPIGFQLDDLRIEFTVEAEQFTEITKQLTIWTDNYEAPVYQSKQEPFKNNYFDVPLTCLPKKAFLKLEKWMNLSKQTGLLIQISPFKIHFFKKRSA